MLVTYDYLTTIIMAVDCKIYPTEFPYLCENTVKPGITDVGSKLQLTLRPFRYLSLGGMPSSICSRENAEAAMLP